MREAETASALSSSEAPVSSRLWEGRQTPSAYVEPSYQPASQKLGNSDSLRCVWRWVFRVLMECE